MLANFVILWIMRIQTIVCGYSLRFKSIPMKLNAYLLKTMLDVCVFCVVIAHCSFQVIKSSKGVSCLALKK